MPIRPCWCASIMIACFLFLGCDTGQNSTSSYKPNYKPIVKRLFIYGNWQEAIAIAQGELQYADIGSEDEIFYLLTLGENYRFAENYEQSEEYLRKVIAHPQSMEYADYLGEAYYGLGDLYYLRWNYFKEEDALSDALMYLDSSMIYAKRSNNLALESKNLYRSGSILQIQGDQERSLENFKKGLEISFSISDTAGIIRNNTHKASELEELGQLDSALFHYNSAYEYAKNQNRNYSEAHSLCNLGQYFMNRGELGVAEEYFKKALFLSEELNHGIVLCRSNYHLSSLQSILGNTDLSRAYIEKGLGIARDMGYKNFEEAFLELGNKLEMGRK